MNRLIANGLALPLCLVTLTTALGAQSARVELDHFFVVVKPGANAEIAALRSAGLTVDSVVSRHDGQGTASVGVFFENAYLELIWIDSTVSVQPEHMKTWQWFRKAEAWRTTGSSPFGFGLRRLAGDTTALPVPVQLEFASWLPPGSAYELLNQPADSLASDFFVVPPSRAMTVWIERFRERAPELLQHPGGGRRISLLRVHGAPGHEPSAFAVLRPEPVQMLRSSEPILEIQFDGGMRGQRRDLRPVLPLLLIR